MSDVLTPQLALAYLAELEPALVSVSIVDHEGRLLARKDAEANATASIDFTVANDRHSMTASSAPGATILEGLARLDLDSVLSDLEREPA